MARHRRIKFEEGESGFLHVYNRAVGNTGEFPFGDMEKEEFIRRVRALNEYYAVEVLAAQAMGNQARDVAARRRKEAQKGGERCMTLSFAYPFLHVDDGRRHVRCAIAGLSFRSGFDSVFLCQGTTVPTFRCQCFVTGAL